jgi:hypothetical protein
MNGAVPERRPATEEISGVIERVTFHNEYRKSRLHSHSYLQWSMGSAEIGQSTTTIHISLSLFDVAFVAFTFVSGSFAAP